MNLIVLIGHNFPVFKSAGVIFWGRNVVRVTSVSAFLAANDGKYECAAKGDGLMHSPVHDRYPFLLLYARHGIAVFSQILRAIRLRLAESNPTNVMHRLRHL